MQGLMTLVSVLGLATAYGVFRRRTDGRLMAGSQTEVELDGTAAVAGPIRDRAALSEAELGQPFGERATLVQFSSAFCQPCRAARVVLAEVAEIVPGVRFVEIDAEANLKLVRELNVLRTPTVIVLDAVGTIRRRASGAPRRTDVLAAVAEVVPLPDPDVLR
jgi:thiol-disulfide isomerase/thioredoxin